MPGEFNGSGLMHIHMTGVRRHHAGVLRSDGIDDDLIGLRSSDQEEDLRVRASAGLLDFGLRTGADVVVAVAGILIMRGFGETGDDFRGRGAGIVIFERQQCAYPFLFSCG